MSKSRRWYDADHETILNYHRYGDLSHMDTALLSEQLYVEYQGKFGVDFYDKT